LTAPRWHILLVLRSFRSLLICRWGKQAVSHLMLGTPTAKTPLNGLAFMCVVPRFPAGIVDYSKLSARMLPIIRASVIGEIL